MENDLKQESFENNNELEKDKTYFKSNKFNLAKKQNTNGTNRKANYSFQKKKNFFSRKKVCYFCQKKVFDISYFAIDILKRYITDRGKIVPSRYTGNCPGHQRIVKKVIKQARMLALLSFCSN